MSITVLKPGLLSTIQDLGRIQYQVKGIGTSGALDLVSHRLANWLVGNNDNEATIELTILGPTLLFQCSAVISICGADVTAKINGQKVENWRPIQVSSGDILTFSTMHKGCRAYLAIRGGIHTPPKFGSRSTDVRSQLGGLQGLPLKAKDQLPITPSHLLYNIQWKLSPILFEHVRESRRVRYIVGKQYNLFTRDSQCSFDTLEFEINRDSNRMGIRLSGPPLHLHTKQELITEGVSHGSVQVPPSGHPIILLSDRQTTGGYPKIAQISSVDLPYLAQRKPGESLTFKKISLTESQQLYVEFEKRMLVQKRIIKEALKGAIYHESY